MNKLDTGLLIDGRYRILDQLGLGGASTVYRVSQSGLDIERALKVLDPHVEGADTDMFERTFREEIKLLSHLSHKNLSKIVDFGEETVGASKLRYFVMEYANSGDLAQISQSLTDVRELLRLIAEVFDAIAYLHERNVLHCDVKPTNILINEDPISGKKEAKLADLGVAKPLGRYTAKPLDLLSTLRDETYLWGSPRYAPLYALEFLNQSRILSREELSHYLPHYDLYCFGAAIAEVLSTKRLQRTASSAEIDRLLESPKSVLRDQLSADQWNYLCDFIRLLLQEDRGRSFKNTTDARDAFARLDVSEALSTLVPELTNVGSRQLITYGHRTARLSDRTYRLVAHPTFQRLQRLNQLNLVEIIYPDARQPRLTHSLEVFELAKEVASHLLGDGTFRLHVSGRELGLFLAASLLHDIGHYPLAHTMEDLRAEITDTARKPAADYDMVAHFLRHKPPGTPRSLADVLTDDWNIECEEIARVVAKGNVTSISEMFVQQLLDGAIDIDKLAYLSGDSRFTGVSYGHGIDIQALIASLRLFSPNRDNVNHPVVGIAHKGIAPAESMIVARYHMFSRVYWHHTNRALMAMARHVIRRVFASEDTPMTFMEYIHGTYGMTDWEALRFMAHRYDAILENECGDKSRLSNPVSGILDGSRQVYKRLLSFSSHPKNPKLSQCHAFLGMASQSSIETLREESTVELGKLMGRRVPESWVLFDMPRMNKEKDTLSEILISDPGSPQGTAQLNEVSGVASSVYSDFLSLAKKSRIFVHPTIREELRSKGLEERAMRRVEEIIVHAARRYG